MQPIYRLPPYRVDSLIAANQLAQVIDWGLLATGVPDAHRVTKGQGVTVAVLDTGYDKGHPDLAGQVAGALDFTGSPSGVADVQGHGTHCAGIVAANDNQEGVIGVAPHAKLLIGKVLGDDGSGIGDWISQGIRWATNQGADVISMSLGSPQPDPKIIKAIDFALDEGKFVICAAGNSGPNNRNSDWPGQHPRVISVASIKKGGGLSDFSSRGKVDFAAPGEQILSCYPTSRYARLSGTSMATPFLAGVVALLLAKHKQAGGGMTPIRTMDDLVQHLKGFAADPVPGQDRGFGWGVVDVQKLIGTQEQQPKPAPTPAPVPPISQPGGLWVFIPGARIQ